MMIMNHMMLNRLPAMTFGTMSTVSCKGPGAKDCSFDKVSRSPCVWSSPSW